MWQFAQTIDGITKACEELETPITGGNVSFYNETLGEGIYPTPVIGIVGILEDVHKAVGPDFKQTGPGAGPAARLGAGRRLRRRGGVRLVGVRQGSPGADLGISRRRWSSRRKRRCRRPSSQMIDEGLVESAKDCTEGGLAVTLAECGFAQGIGAQVDLSFGRAGCRVRSVRRRRQPDPDFLRPGNVERIKEVAVKYALSAEQIGSTVPDNLEIRVDGKVAAAAPVSELKQVWATALEDGAAHGDRRAHWFPVCGSSEAYQFHDVSAQLNRQATGERC